MEIVTTRYILTYIDELGDEETFRAVTLREAIGFAKRRMHRITPVSIKAVA